MLWIRSARIADDTAAAISAILMVATDTGRCPNTFAPAPPPACSLLTGIVQNAANLGML